MIRICHLTSAHSRYDIRIFLKECKSLAQAEYEVNLIVADGNGYELKDGVKIIDVGKPNGRLMRFTTTVWKIFRAARSLNAQIYHFHDPDLMFIALLLKKNGKKVIYDAHEDFPQQLKGKYYLNKSIANFASIFFEYIERKLSRRYSFIITATPTIKNKFKRFTQLTEVVNNYPLENELSSGVSNWDNRENMVCFIGGVGEIRGTTYVVRAMKYVSEARLIIAGKISPDFYSKKLLEMTPSNSVDYMGHVSRSVVRDVLSKSKAGIVTYLPLPNHINAQPNKLFEYMSSGVPVIASNFPLWREIIEDNKCGIVVNPQDEQEIANAINYILSHNDEAESMGSNGRRAVREKYNWENESKTLKEIYRSLIE